MVRRTGPPEQGRHSTRFSGRGGQYLAATSSSASTPAGRYCRKPVVPEMRRLIEANVPEPDLGPEFLCQRLGMSRAKLYRLFKPIGGVGAYIQQRRLTRAYHALTDPAQAHLYVGMIATRCGFGSASVFSRAFRQAFGLSPTDLRATHHHPDADNTNHATTTRLRACGGSCLGWERGGGRGRRGRAGLGRPSKSKQSGWDRRKTPATGRHFPLSSLDHERPLSGLRPATASVRNQARSGTALMQPRFGLLSRVPVLAQRMLCAPRMDCVVPGNRCRARRKAASIPSER